MAGSISAEVLIWVVSIQLFSQALAISNNTGMPDASVPEFSVEGKTISESIKPNRRDLLSIDAFYDSLYLSPLTFRSNYEHMLGSFKIYIYPRKKHDFGSPEWCSDERFRELDIPGALFYERLVNSEFITDDPEKAHLFFLPFSVAAMEIRLPGSVSRSLRRYIEVLRMKYPYWNRTLGADHFYVSCGRVDIDSHRNVVELKKNAIQVFCYPLPHGGNGHIYPHKDISIPPIGSVVGIRQTLDFNGRESPAILAYHVGPLELIPSIESILELWKSDPDFVLDPILPEHYVYAERLSSSRFCLDFVGNGGNSSILVDALAFGCIPVIISQGPLFDLPFQDILKWKEFVVIINMRQVRNLKQTLQSIPETQFQKMQILSIKASKHLSWNSTPQSYDAFYGLMYQLWLRRHTIRYARRHRSS